MSVGVMKDEKLNLRHLHDTVLRGVLEHLKPDKDEVNKREVCECDG